MHIYPQITIKKMLLFFFTEYKNAWKFDDKKSKK